ncbi:MAG TPA: dihydroorotase [Limnochordales bacterium]
MRLWVRGGRVLDAATGLDAQLDVLIEDGRVARLSAPGPYGSASDEVVDARGCWVVPGLVDLCVHCGQPGHERRETLAEMVQAACWGGVTTLVIMPDTEPPVDSPAMVEQLHALAGRDGRVQVHVAAALTRGRQGQELAGMGGLARAGAVAFTDDDRPVMDSALMRHAMAYAAQLQRPVLGGGLDPGLSRGGLVREGAVSFRLGLPGIPAEAESVLAARDLELARLTGCTLHLARVSTLRTLELLAEARRRGLPVSASVSAHHLLLTWEALEGYDPSAKLWPPLGSPEDREGLRRALAEGLVDCVVSDHRALAPEEVQGDLASCPFGAAGLQTLAACVLGEMVHEGALEPLQAVRAVTWAPARLLGLPAGTLQEGARADVVVFDPARRWVVEPTTWPAGGRNSPLAGRPMRGQVVATIAGGRLVMRDGQLCG